jgi:hypothetical protein
MTNNLNILQCFVNYLLNVIVQHKSNGYNVTGHKQTSLCSSKHTYLVFLAYPLYFLIYSRRFITYAFDKASLSNPGIIQSLRIITVAL